MTSKIVVSVALIAVLSQGVLAAPCKGGVTRHAIPQQQQEASARGIAEGDFAERSFLGDVVGGLFKSTVRKVADDPSRYIQKAANGVTKVTQTVKDVKANRAATKGRAPRAFEDNVDMREYYDMEEYEARDVMDQLEMDLRDITDVVEEMEARALGDFMDELD